MAIHLDGRTKLTAEVEKHLVELGGADPDKTLTHNELAGALVNAIDTLSALGMTHILEKIYLSHRATDPALPSLEQINAECAQADVAANDSEV